eukprot:TRINITY_DN33167_c0_g1_i1.p1 TRINITY_DN33167_c0_g1~~TRINITY_DN33167_c0_g1_i1.p1  ORF type:complete len:124 (+),score=31.33 TRINITY_DN33167_c0_g1_i1:363-734(+)
MGSPSSAPLVVLLLQVLVCACFVYVEGSLPGPALSKAGVPPPQRGVPKLLGQVHLPVGLVAGCIGLVMLASGAVLAAWRSSSRARAYRSSTQQSQRFAANDEVINIAMCDPETDDKLLAYSAE